MATWMVVEDEPNIYELLMAMFEMWGIAGRAFIDGEEAMSWINDVDNVLFKGDMPELVLLDIRLPGDIQGDDVGDRLRKSARLGKVPIVIISAFTFSAEDRATIERRVKPDLWLQKPLPKFNQLQTILEETIARNRDKQRAESAPTSAAEPEADQSSESENPTIPPRRRPRRRLN